MSCTRKPETGRASHAAGMGQNGNVKEPEWSKTPEAPFKVKTQVEKAGSPVASLFSLFPQPPSIKKIWGPAVSYSARKSNAALLQRWKRDFSNPPTGNSAPLLQRSNPPSQIFYRTKARIALWTGSERQIHLPPARDKSVVLKLEKIPWTSLRNVHYGLVCPRRIFGNNCFGYHVRHENRGIT